jgi:mycothiol system anti-sigma-R factor
MNCAELGRWIGPLLDGELDARNTAEIQAHLDGCPGCQQEFEAQQALVSNIRRLDLAYAAPASLRDRIHSALDSQMLSDSGPRAPAPKETQRARRDLGQWLVWAGWPAALVASALLATVMLQQRNLLAEDIVAAHVRSLQADHLSDVVSTSHHTVKPWFAGKVDFSPPVPDLSSQGFELVGGRLDYLEGQPVAAVIYRKHGHIINVLAGLPGHELDKLPHSEHVQGYSLRSWRQGGLVLVAISDIDPRELANLEESFESPPAQTAD